MISGVSRWLVDVKRDLETPDLWAELQREAQLLGDASDEATENTPFTPDEQKEIAMRLQGMAEQARHTYSLSEEQMRVLNAKIDYLKAAAGRLGRIHWRDVFLGVMFTFVLASALPPESVRHIVLTILRTIVQHHGFPELPNG